LGAFRLGYRHSMNDHGKPDRNEGHAKSEGSKAKPTPRRPNPKGKADRAPEKRSPEMERADVANGEKDDSDSQRDPPPLPG